MRASTSGPYTLDGVQGRGFGPVLALLGLLGLHANGALAQDVRDVVREHLEQELEQKPEQRSQPTKPRSKPRPAARAPRAQPISDPDTSIQFSISSDGDTPPEPNPGPELPQRLFGKQLRIDLMLGGGYRGWLPQQFPHVDVDVGTYYVWTIEVKAKIFSFLNLHRGYYESNALAGPRTDEAAVAAQVASYVPKVAWVLGVLGFPIFKAWEPILRYESRAFHTEAHPKQPVCVVTDAVASDLSSCTRSTGALRMSSGFETLVAGVRYDQSKEPSPVIETRTSKLPPITVGLGLMSYRKPYQVNVNGNTLDGYLFDGQFRGAGIMLGSDVGGGPDKFFMNIDAQFGLGEVKLTRSLTLNALAPEDWLMGYVQGNATVGYYLPLLRAAPTLMFVPKLTMGGASFFFFKTQQREGEKSDAASVNWDLLWAVNAVLTLSL
jgi:hypothetical protein